MNDSQLYDKMVKESKTGHQYTYSLETIKFLDSIVPRKGKILDIGCGTGYVAQFLNDRRWYGVDVSKKSIEVAKPFYEQAKVCDITKRIAYPDNYFDVVYALGIFHHIPDRIPQALREARRVLKRGGTMIIVDHNRGNIMVKHAHEGPLKIVPCDNERTFSLREFKKTIEHAGFVQVGDVRYVHIEGYQQSMVPSIQTKILKCPILYVMGKMTKESTDFLMRVKKK